MWEENIQESVSNYYKQYYGKATLDTDSNDMAGVLGNYTKGVAGFARNMIPGLKNTKAGTNEDAQSAAIFLGGIMGGPSELLSQRLEAAAKAKQWDDLKTGW